MAVDDEAKNKAHELIVRAVRVLGLEFGHIEVSVANGTVMKVDVAETWAGKDLPRSRTG